MTEDVANPAVPAATVILVRDGDARTGARGHAALEAAMVERHADIGFAGGALVFPGGRVDPTDGSAAWRDRSRGLSPYPELSAGQVAAIREAFEEVGVLIARRRGDEALLGAAAAGLSDWRVRSEQDDAAFLEMACAHDLELACDQLALFAHWSPPPALHKRFDTLFFIAIAPEGQSLVQDGVEATEAMWITPAEALTSAAEGRRKIIFPTARNLELLGLSATAADAVASAKRRKVRKIVPEIVERDGEAFLCIPEDQGYPVTEERLDRAARG